MAAVILLRWAALWLVWTGSAHGFIHAQIGSTIRNRELPALAGGTHPLLSNTTVNVFVFVRPGQEFSRTTLKRLAQLEKELAGKPVHLVSIVSDRFARAEAEAEVKASGITMPVLIDTGDDLYGELGVVLCPVVGMTDQHFKLTAYQAFTKVNYLDVIRARIRHQLKEITDAELAQVLNPPAADTGGEAVAARRRLKLAEKQFAAGNAVKALENVLKCLEKDAQLVPAHVLHGRILALQGKCPEAVQAFDRALVLDPACQPALEGKKACLESAK